MAIILVMNLKFLKMNVMCGTINSCSSFLNLECDIPVALKLSMASTRMCAPILGLEW